MADKKISALTASTTPLAGTEVLPIVQGGSTVKVAVSNLTAGRTVSMSSLGVGTATPVNTASIVGNALSVAGATDGSGVLKLGDPTQIDPYVGVYRGAAATIGTAGNFLNLGGYDGMVFTVGTASLATQPERMRIDGSGNITATTGNLVIGTAGKGIDFSANTHAAGMTSELLDWYEEGAWTPSLFDSEGNALTIGTAIGRYTRVGNVVTLTCSVSWTGLGSANASPLLLAGLPFASVNVANLNQSGTIGFMSGIDTVLGTKQITANLPLNASFFTFRQTNDNAAPTDLPANSCSATGEIRLSATYIV